MCDRSVEDWKHVWEKCEKWRAVGTWEKMVGKLLGDNGEKEQWLRKLEKFRGGGEENREEKKRNKCIIE